MMNVIEFAPDTIQKAARKRLQGESFPEIFVTQALTEATLLFKKKVAFRTRRNDAAVRAYSEMSVEEFEGVNARQRWANWRTIPKNLSGRLPNRPMMAVDLCCGVGHSTQVLAHYLPEGSRILGLEYNPAFVEAAREADYPHAKGGACQVEFRAQSVLEPFLDASGELLADESVDLVNSSGAVGCHFDIAASEKLTREIRRVLRPNGLALIDSGLPGTDKVRLTGIFRRSGFEAVHSAKSCALDLYTQICFRKIASF